MQHHDRTIVVVRHGITEQNASGVWQGHWDTNLSDPGHAQARDAASHLAEYEPQFIVSSDLKRAIDTAMPVCELLGMDLLTDERFREIEVGKWQGMAKTEVEAQWPGAQERIMNGEDLRRGETGETLLDVAARVRRGIDDHLERLAKGEVAIVVAHGISGRMLVAELVGMSHRTAWLGFSGLGNCHWGELREHDGAWRLFGWNYNAPDPVDDESAWQAAF